MHPPLVTAILLLSLALAAQAQSTAFTYQGRFAQNGTPFNGQAEFQFTLWDAATTGNQLAATSPAETTVSVTNGLFTVSLDFGAAAFDGADRWLEIRARTTIGAYTTLTPRQPLSPTPYALRALTVNSGGLSGGTYANAVTFDNAANSFSGSYAGTFSGDGANVSGVDAQTVGGVAADRFWQLGGNAGTTPGTDFLGTTDNQPFEIKVNGLRAMRFEDNGDSNGPKSDGAPNVIGGSPVNFVAAGVVGATIAGGGATNYFGGGGVTNSVRADFGSVLGGVGNTASGYASTAMGCETTASGDSSTAMGRDTTASGFASTAMGRETTASGHISTAMGENTTASGYASTAMGAFTTASGYASTAMGYGTDASGNASTAMGNDTTASGECSTAMGSRARANHTGTFVWADKTAADFPSGQNNEFAIRASGGMRVSSDNSIITGFNIENTTIPTGSGKWLQQVVGSGVSGRVGNFAIWYVGGGNSSLTLQPDGDVGVGTTTPTFKLHVNGTAGKPGGGSWSTTSDARLKDVGQPFTRGLEDLEKIEPKHYHYSKDNALKLPSDREYIGLIAQNVQAAIPEAIEPNDTGYLHVNNDPILWTMLNSIKELNQKLESENAELNARLEKLEALLNDKLNGGVK